MLNLRQFNKSEHSQSDSDAQHFSRFSVSFRVPSSLLGNIGEPLDHSQSERLHEDESATTDAEEVELDTTKLESTESVAGPSGTRWDEDSNVNGIGRQSSPPNAGFSGSRRDHWETVDVSLREVANVTDIQEVRRSVTLTEQVRAVSQLQS